MRVSFGGIAGGLVGLVLGAWLFGERGRLMQPSSRAFAHLLGTRGLANLGGLHGYVYGRWTNQYMAALIHFVFPALGARGRAWLHERYHAKVLTQEQAEAIVALDHDLPLQDLEQVIPYPTARDIVLNGPPDVTVFECACRHARANPCQPTQVCMAVGQPFADFVAEHNPDSSRRVSQAEALELLRAEHERGHLHSAWFRDVCLDRFYAICNCCKCCCGGVESMVKYGSGVMASSGYVAQVDASLCNGCERCVRACPFGALGLSDDVCAVDWHKCMGCGVCTAQCRDGAISLVRDEQKGVPLDVRTLAQA
jgi:ferredoxin